MSEGGISELIQRSTFVFAGTVQVTGRSSVRVLASQPDFALVRFDHGFLIDPALGTLRGRPITVRQTERAAAAGATRPGERVIFFATAWVHGEEIAVTELARLPADERTEEEVARAVAELPELHLSRRVAAAVLIVHGTVVEIARATDVPRIGSEHDPLWLRALIDVREVIKGQLDTPVTKSRRGRAVLLFPGSRDRAFLRTPRPAERQEGVFLLHAGGDLIPAGMFIAPDPADIQAPHALPTVRRLLDGAPPRRRPPG